MTKAGLFDLMSWMSPAWPVGAFAHSSGLEWAVEAGLVTDAATTQNWIEDWITLGGGWSDAVIFTFAHRAACAGEARRLTEIAELSLALQTTAERRIEATAQGGAFRRISLAAADCVALQMLASLADEELTYAVAAAVVIGGRGAGEADGLTAFLHGVVSNLASAAQRLVPLGQTETQRLIANLKPVVEQVVRDARALSGDPFDHVGGAAFMADIASMAHETQYTRLFRT